MLRMSVGALIAAAILAAGCSETRNPVAVSTTGIQGGGGAAATAGKADVCHRTDSGGYQLLRIGASAWPAHQAHGDGVPFGPVPGGGGDQFSATCVPQPTYSVGGTVSGLEGSGLELQNNGGNTLAIAGNGSFVFTVALVSGQNYNVTVLTQPSGPAQECTVSNGSGTIAAGNVTDVSVDCVTTARRVFVSSAGYSANFGGYIAADAICMNLASAAGLGGNWKAWISTSTSSPSARFTHSTVPYVRVDGTQIADDWADLTDGSLDAGITLNEYGVAVLNSEVWTATHTSGTYAGSSCNDFTSNANGAPYSAVGVSDRNSYQWTNVYLEFCDRPALRLYCFEQ